MSARRLVLVVAGILFAVAAARAQGFGGGQGMGPRFGGGRKAPMEQGFGPAGGGKSWWNNPRIVAQLKLTDEQRKAMDGIMLEHREKLVDLHANLEKAELGMQPLMAADTPNDAAIVSQIDKVVTARGELEKANARFLLAIRDKLTPDQWKQVKTFRENGGMRGEMHGRMGDGQRRGWGGNGQGRGMQRPGGQGPNGQAPDGQGPGMMYRHRQAPSTQTPPPPSPGSAAPGAGAGDAQ